MGHTKRENKPRNNMCWTQLYAHKHTYRKYDMSPPTNRRKRRIDHRFYAEIVTDITTRNPKYNNKVTQITRSEMFGSL